MNRIDGGMDLVQDSKVRRTARTFPFAGTRLPSFGHLMAFEAQFQAEALKPPSCS